MGHESYQNKMMWDKLQHLIGLCDPAYTSVQPSKYHLDCFMGTPEISVHELNEQRQKGTSPFLLDVRKPREANIAEIGGTLIPLDELPQRIDELEPHKDEKIVVHCRSGGRSERAVQFLRDKGYDAFNLKGGILAWSKEIDSSVPRY